MFRSLATAATPAPAAQAPLARQKAPGALLAGPEPAWSFRSAAPVSAGPTLLPGGGAVIATVEGYVHRLDGEGALEWSHTLRGSPLGGVSIDAEGSVYVATSAGLVYALDPAGHRSWSIEPQFSPITPVLWAPPGVVYFAAEDRRLYALSAQSGALLWHRPLEHRATGKLALTPRGLVVLGTRAPEVWLIQDAVHAERVELPAELAQPPLFGGERWFVQAGSELVAYDRESHGVLWRRPGQHAALDNARSALVLEQAGALVWLATDSGQTLQRRSLPVAASAPPALIGSDLVLVPTASGVLLVLGPEPDELAPVRVSWGPLHTPVYDPSARQALVSGGDGVITALEIGRWLDRRDGA